MPKYTTKTKVETYLDKTITATIDDLIDAVEKYIDNKTGRNFVADVTATARVYDGDNSQVLLIDDCVEVTKVELGDDMYGDAFTDKTLDTDYKLLPANYDGLGVPIRKVFLRSNVFYAGVQNHRITAKWGYSTTAPDDIVWVATFLASSVYNNGVNGSLGGVKSERIGEYQVSFSERNELADFKKAEAILNSYKRYRL